MKHPVAISLIPLLSFFCLSRLHAQSLNNRLNTDSELIQSKIDSLFIEWDNSEKPGASIAVVLDGEVKYKRAYGMANLEYDIPNTPSTIFQVASISKQFTVFSILLLQQQGALSLDDDIRKYIPEVPDFGHTITLRHLASHTSGLRDQSHLFFLAGVRPDDVITNEHFLSLISQQKELNFVPGDEYLYSNTGFILLAEVVARVSGRSFAEFTQEFIFRPLKMSSTSFIEDHEKIIKKSAYSYYSLDGQVYKKRVFSSSIVGSTNLLTTVEDLSLWVINFEDPKVGTVELFDLMKTEAVLNDGSTYGGGLGIFINNKQGITEIEHGGAEAGFRSQLSIFSSMRFAVIVLSNNARINASGLATNIADLYLKNFYHQPDLVSEEKRDFIMLKPEEMEPFVGYYWSKDHGFTRHIYLRNDTLMHFRTENNESWLNPISENSFKVMDVPPNVIIHFTSQNGALKMTETVNNGKPKPLEPYKPKEYTEKDWLMFEGTYYSKELKTVYTIEWNKGEKLIAKHIRMGNIELSRLKHNFFLGSKGFFGNIEFLSDDNENITGFRVSNGRVRNILFDKQHTTKDKIH